MQNEIQMLEIYKNLIIEKYIDISNLKKNVHNINILNLYKINFKLHEKNKIYTMMEDYKN